MVNTFLHHVDQKSQEPFAYANIYHSRHDNYRVELECSCGCNHRFVRNVDHIAKAWQTVHVINEICVETTILPRFVRID
ncbi:hypothetical protein KSB_39570 [Ktedonobacter robiniae]|uniref:Uncharacterized protein n=1 Tax=Ktedonobacter robiniae TaxID=2778365 RepID=A0ABQ3USX3_9CHLR|nr:hypothetical protein KSB_39570 [Ktedonobacter robiniae]